VRGRGVIPLIKNSWRLLRGVVQAVQLIRRERPRAVFGTGGYVCVPLFVAAWLMRVPECDLFTRCGTGACCALAVATCYRDTLGVFPMRRPIWGCLRQPLLHGNAGRANWW
jgi:hypothetical protein